MPGGESRNRRNPVDSAPLLARLERALGADSVGGVILTASDGADAVSLARSFFARHPERRSTVASDWVEARDTAPADLPSLAGDWERILRASDEQSQMILVDMVDPRPTREIEAMLFVARRTTGSQVSVVFTALAGDPRLEGSGLPTIAVPDESAAISAIWIPQRAEGSDPHVRRWTSELESLPTPTRFLVEQLAVMGETQLSLLAAASGAEVDLADLAPAEAAGMAIVDFEAVRIADDDLRNVVYVNIDEDRRLAAHQRAAAAISASDDPDLLAWHRAAGELSLHDDAVEELLDTLGRVRARGGHALASIVFERAAGLSTRAGRRGELLVEAGFAAWQSGSARRAQDLLTRAEPLIDDAAPRATAAFVAGALAQSDNHPDDAFALLVSGAVAALTQRTGFAAELAARVAGIAWWLGRIDWAAVAVGVAERAAEVDDSSFGQFVKSMTRAGLRILRHDFDVVPEILEALSRTDGFAGRQLLFVGEVSGLVGDDLRALAVQDAAVKSIRDSGAQSELPFALELSSLVSAWHGQLDVAASVGDEGLELAERFGEETRGPFQYAMLTHVAALRGDEVSCRRCAEQALASTSDASVATVYWALGRLELALGRPTAASRELMRIFTGGATHPLTMMYAAPDFVEAAVDSGDRAVALKAAEPFLAWADAGSPWASAIADRVRGLLAEGSASIEFFEKSLDADGRAARPFDHARTQLLLGRQLRRSRRRNDSREHLRASAITFSQLGMDAWSARARAELRASGETIAAGTADAHSALTAHEAEVAALVAEVASNRDVAARLHVSPRTVEYHLAKVYVKLGISSRAQLPAAFETTDR